MALLRQRTWLTGQTPLLSRPSLGLPPLHPAARGLGRAQKVPAACPGGPAPTLDQTAPCIISSSSPGSGRRRCGDQLGPWSGDPGQGSTLPTTTSAPSARPQSCPSQFPRGSNGVTASLPQGPGCSRASGVNRPAEGGLQAGPVLQPSVHRPPRRPPRRSGLLVQLPQLGPWETAARGPGRGSGPTPELRVADGSGLAGGGKRPPYSPGARRRWPPRACALARPCAPCRRRDRKASAAIWWRRLGSCGAERGGRVRNTPIRGLSKQNTSKKPHASTPVAAPIPQAEREWLAFQERQCVQWSAPGL